VRLLLMSVTLTDMLRSAENPQIYVSNHVYQPIGMVCVISGAGPRLLLQDLLSQMFMQQSCRWEVEHNPST
jgi:hypothetical protein